MFLSFKLFLGNDLRAFLLFSVAIHSRKSHAERFNEWLDVFRGTFKLNGGVGVKTNIHSIFTQKN